MTTDQSGWSFTTFLPLYVCGAIILAALGAYVRLHIATGSPVFLILMLSASLAYLFALSQIRRLPENRWALSVCLLIAALWRVPLLGTPAGRHDDVFRYIWDARLQRLGYDPYRSIPTDPALAHVHTPETRLMNHPTLPSPYPPGAQYFFRAVTVWQESVRAVRLALVLCDGLIALLLIWWLAASDRSRWWALAYAWNPLIAIEVAGNGHLDILGALIVFASFALVSRGRFGAALTMLALAVSVKFLPIVLAPLFWRRAKLSHWIVSGALLGALYLPFAARGGLSFGSLGAFVDRFRFNDPIFSLVERFVAPRVAAGIAVAAGLVVAAWMRLRRGPDDPVAWSWPVAAALVCAPVVYPWYLLWLTPFLTVVGTLPLLVWTQSILFTYIVWHAELNGAPWRTPAWVTLVEFGAVACTGFWVMRRRRRTRLRSVPDGTAVQLW